MVATSTFTTADANARAADFVASGAVRAPLGLDWRTIDWRSHARYVFVQGRRVNLVDLGEGSPMVFIHGLAGCWQNWLPNLPAAAAAHRVIALDLPGFGRSEMARDRISIGGYADCVSSLCDVLGIETATLVGNSMGGFVAAELAISRSRLVERLVLVDAAGLSTEELHYRPRFTLARLVRSVGLSRLAKMPVVAERPRLRRLVLGLIVNHPERLSSDLVLALLDGAGKEGLRQALATLSREGIRDCLHLIGCPTLIVWGEKDRLVPVGDAFRLQSEIAGSQLVVFPDAGHLPMIESPDRFNALLAKFSS